MAEEKKEVKKEKRPTAQKRDIQNEKRRLMNKTFTSSVKTAIRQFDDAIEKGNATETQECLKTVYSLMDKGIKRGSFKHNTASRTKSRLSARAAKV